MSPSSRSSVGIPYGGNSNFNNCNVHINNYHRNTDPAPPTYQATSRGPSLADAEQHKQTTAQPNKNRNVQWAEDVPRTAASTVQVIIQPRVCWSQDLYDWVIPNCPIDTTDKSLFSGGLERVSLHPDNPKNKFRPEVVKVNQAVKRGRTTQRTDRGRTCLRISSSPRGVARLPRHLVHFEDTGEDVEALETGSISASGQRAATLRRLEPAYRRPSLSKAEACLPLGGLWERTLETRTEVEHSPLVQAAAWESFVPSSCCERRY